MTFERRRHERAAAPRAPGTPPGTLNVNPLAAAPVLHVIAYGPEDLVEQTLDDWRQVQGFVTRYPVCWVNVDGLGDREVLTGLGEVFSLHPLALEDVINVHQRPKVEQYDQHLFVIARMLTLGQRLETEQLSLFLGTGYVLTFQEHPGDCLDPIRERLRKAGGRLRRAGADYLAYALIDAVVDSYFPVLELFGERLETLEDEIVAHPDVSTVTQIHQAKRDLLTFRRAIWPERDALNALLRDDTPLVTAETRLYLRDCYDHTIRLIDILEVYRELASGLLDFYMSSISNRMNEVMKVLTVIATIFIPLTFIAGVYGMNFEYMPELRRPWAYPAVWGVMLLVAVGMLAFFRRRGWLGAQLTPAQRARRLRRKAARQRKQHKGDQRGQETRA